MPKRAEAYMASQREHITSVVFELIKDVGLYQTTLRMICEKAGVSMGAFYVHFSSKEEAVDAAFLYNAQRAELPDAPETWEAFETLMGQTFACFDDPERRKLGRLSLEFTAAALDSDKTSETSVFTSQVSFDFLKRTLTRFRDEGEIAEDTDVDALTWQITSLSNGTFYIASLLPKMRTQKALDDMLSAIRKLAGRS